MSSVLVDSLPLRSPRREQPTRRIEIVSTRAQRRARPRPLYALIAIGGLFAVFMAQLLMSIVVSDGAYQISSLQSEQSSLTRQQQSLGEQVDTLASTQNLAAKAEALGMVASTASPAFLDVSTGKVVGKSHTAGDTADGLLAGTGNLVPNSLLPDDATEDTLDADAATATTVTDPTDPVVDGTPVTATDTAATTTDATATDTTAATTGTTTDSTSGAPSTDGTTSNVPSTGGGLPVPVTH